MVSNLLSIAEWLFLVCLGLVVYAWGLYPALLLLAARSKRGGYPTDSEPRPWPRVAVLLAAHNEEQDIVARLENLLTADYPPERLQILVGIDAGEDRTAELAGNTAANHEMVQVFPYKRRRGKVAVLKDLVHEVDAWPEASAPELLVLTDANTRFDRNALKALARPFSDPAVGGVCGRLILTADKEACIGDSRLPEGRYWRWETRLKDAESALDSCLGANGAIYAMRAPLFWRAIPENTVIDDFVLGMKVREQGYRMFYEPTAMAFEVLPVTAAEWGRRVRIGAGDFQAIGLCRRCLLPSYGVFAWMFLSHKILRWITPYLVVGSALCAAWLITAGGSLGSMPQAFLAGLVGTGILAALGGRVPFLRPIASACLHFVVMNAALLVGSIRCFKGGLAGHWQRTER